MSDQTKKEQETSKLLLKYKEEIEQLPQGEQRYLKAILPNFSIEVQETMIERSIAKDARDKEREREKLERAKDPFGGDRSRKPRY